MTVEKLCGVDPASLASLGITHEGGVFRVGLCVLSDEEVLTLLNLALRGIETCINGMHEARAFMSGLDDIEVGRIVQAGLERRVAPQRFASAGYTLLPDGPLALVQGNPRVPKGEPGSVAGQIAWWEHESAWHNYAARFGKSQSAQRIHDRGGFCYLELVDQLGRKPFTWRPR